MLVALITHTIIKPGLRFGLSKLAELSLSSLQRRAQLITFVGCETLKGLRCGQTRLEIADFRIIALHVSPVCRLLICQHLLRAAVRCLLLRQRLLPAADSLRQLTPKVSLHLAHIRNDSPNNHGDGWRGEDSGLLGVTHTALRVLSLPSGAAPFAARNALNVDMRALPNTVISKEERGLRGRRRRDDGFLGRILLLGTALYAPIKRGEVDLNQQRRRILVMVRAGLANPQPAHPATQHHDRVVGKTSTFAEVGVVGDGGGKVQQDPLRWNGHFNQFLARAVKVHANTDSRI